MLEAPTFDGHPDPWMFTKWLHEMDQFFNQIGLLDAEKTRVAKMKLTGTTSDYSYDLKTFVLEERSLA
jgi:hypothetical protein